MRRRALLRTAALAGAAGLAGCTSDGPADGGGGGQDDGSPTESPTDTPTESPTDSPSDAPTDTPTDSSSDAHTGSPTDEPTDTDDGTPTRTPIDNGMVDESFEVTGQGCGEGQNAVDITFDGDIVRLDGVIDGRNGCYTAEQESAVYDAADDRLSVNVRAYEPDDAGMCTQCIVDIAYEARYTFEEGTPKEVAVSHDGREIARAGQGSATATPEGT